MAEQIDALRRIAGDKVAARIRREPDAMMMRIVDGWPQRVDAQPRHGAGLSRRGFVRRDRAHRTSTTSSAGRLRNNQTGGRAMRSMRKLLDLLDIDTPVILAPMAGTSSPELTAAVANAGGLGSYGCSRLSPAEVEKEADRIRALPTAASTSDSSAMRRRT